MTQQIHWPYQPKQSPGMGNKGLTSTYISRFQHSHILQVEVSRFQVIEMPLSSKYWKTIGYCA